MPSGTAWYCRSKVSRCCPPPDGQTVTTRGNPTNFQAGVNGLVTKIGAADTLANKAKIPVTLYETQPLASYGFTRSNPAEPIFGSSTGGLNAPYVGADQPIQQMASDLHNAFTAAAASANLQGGSAVGVAFAGDVWITAMNIGLAVTNPYLTTNPADQISLWDTDAIAARCTTPIGYHPSKYGCYLNALVLFDQSSGLRPPAPSGVAVGVRTALAPHPDVKDRRSAKATHAPTTKKAGEMITGLFHWQ